MEYQVTQLPLTAAPLSESSPDDCVPQADQQHLPLEFLEEWAGALDHLGEMVDLLYQTDQVDEHDAERIAGAIEALEERIASLKQRAAQLEMW